MMKEGILDRYVRSQIEADREAGRVGDVAVQVCQGGNVLWEAYFGEATEKSLFRMASMTKPVTATAVLIAAEAGLLTLDDPVARYLPAYGDLTIGTLVNGQPVPVRKVQTAPTIRNLLTHSSGIGSGEIGALQEGMLSREDRKNLESVVARYPAMLLDFEPFTAQAYSPVAGFDIAARIVEITSGESFDDFLRKNLFMPLGMKDTTFTPTEEQWKRMIPMSDFCEGHCVHADFSPRSIFADFPTSYFCGGAGLASTLRDYGKFASMLLRKGRVGDIRVLSEASVQDMQKSHLPDTIHVNPEQWGLGVRTITKHSNTCLPVGCFGWSGAYGTHFWVDPVNDITAVYMKNSLYDGGSGAMTARHFEEAVMHSIEESA